MSAIVVSGTGTGVGKTVVTAALASLALDRSSSVAVVKPAQTGVGPAESGDVDHVRALAGDVDGLELVRYPDPLSPAAASRLSGIPPIDLYDAVRVIEELTRSHELVLVEGAGGLLVRFDDDGATLADLARALGAPVLVVAAPGLGTLNATAMTLEVMAHRGVQLADVVIGSWPEEPDLAMRCNVRDLETLAARPLGGALPDGAGSLAGADFLAAARAGLSPSYGGSFRAADFRDRHDPGRPDQ